MAISDPERVAVTGIQCAFVYWMTNPNLANSWSLDESISLIGVVRAVFQHLS